MTYYVYILECAEGKLYTGYTNDLEKRFQAHVNGSANCKFTRSFPPHRIAASWQYATKSEALKQEWRIKRMSRESKIKLVASASAAMPG